MIHLTPEGAATTLAAIVVILVSMAVRSRQRRNARAVARYRRGEQDREVSRLKADVLEQINCDAGRLA